MKRLPLVFLTFCGFTFSASAGAESCNQAAISSIETNSENELNALDRESRNLWQQTKSMKEKIDSAFESAKAHSDSAASGDVAKMRDTYLAVESDYKDDAKATLTDDIKEYRNDRAILGRLAAGDATAQSAAPSWFEAAKKAQEKGPALENLQVKSINEYYLKYLYQGKSDLARVSADTFNWRSDTPAIKTVRQQLVSQYLEARKLNARAISTFETLKNMHAAKGDCLSSAAKANSTRGTNMHSL